MNQKTRTEDGAVLAAPHRTAHLGNFRKILILRGPRARAVAIAFWTAPNESSLADYEALCVPLYTRAKPPEGFYDRAVRNHAMRLLFFETELLRLDLLKRLDLIKCPTLIIAGEDDPITPLADMEDTGAAIRPDLVGLESFARKGHGVYRDRPEAFFPSCEIL